MISRPAAVAGMFYPSDSVELATEIAHCFKSAQIKECPNISGLQAVIVPHAGYVYSGQVAASIYRLVETLGVSKVAVLGPSHRIPLLGVAAPSVEAFSTPLGDVPLDIAVIKRLHSEGLIKIDDAPHALEHSLEVQVPFLQSCLKQFSLVPLVVGDASEGEVETIIKSLMDEGFFVVVSSDLSHFHSYDEAETIDRSTSRKILEKQGPLHGEEACGCRPINGLLKLASALNWSVQQVARNNSGDTAGDKARVVGYGGFAFYQ